jgi:hypothetical protein
MMPRLARRLARPIKLLYALKIHVLRPATRRDLLMGSVL